MIKLHKSLRTINNILLIPVLAIIALSIFGFANNVSLLFTLLISLLFLSEWAIGLFLAEDKITFCKNPYNIADFISAIPIHPSFAGARIIRLIRIVKVASLIFRARKIQRKIFPLIKVGLLVVTILMTGAFVFEQIEPQMFENKSPYWETFQTLVTGEFSTQPQTTQGRFIGAMIMILGIGVFGYAAGFASSILDDSDEQEIFKKLSSQIDSLENKIDSLTNN